MPVKPYVKRAKTDGASFMSLFTESSFGAQYNWFVKQSVLETKKIAKQLNDVSCLLALDAAADGLASSLSQLKYYVNLYASSRAHPFSSSDLLHDWSITPLGITFILLQSAVLMTASVLSCITPDDGYALYFMSLEEAKKYNHVNCFVWDESELIYISPANETTTLNTNGVVDTEFVKKLKKKACDKTHRAMLSVEKANKLLIKKDKSFAPAPPTATWQGTVASYWPYARDCLKAMKNTDTAVRNVFVLTDLLIVGREYHMLATPIGLALGIAAAYNRTWLRKIRSERRAVVKQNKEQLKSVRQQLGKAFVNDSLNTLDDWNLLFEEMHQDALEQDRRIQLQKKAPYFGLYAHLSGAASAVFDSPYLYFGALNLAVLSVASGLFIFIASASVFYALICIVTRIYEENNMQRELLASQLELKLALSIKKIQLLLAQEKWLKKESLSLDKNSAEEKQQQLKQALNQEWLKSELLKNKLLFQTQFSWLFILMTGIKNALDTYGALASLMFLIAAINLVILVPNLPILVVCFVSLGLGAMLLFPAIALIKHALQEKTETPFEAKKKSTLQFFSDVELELTGKTSEYQKSSDPDFWDEILEIGRGACSGGRKGINVIERFMAIFQERGADGHYHDTHEMWPFAWVSAGVFSIVFAIKRFARFGKDLQEETVDKKKPPVIDAPANEVVVAELPEVKLTTIAPEPEVFVEPIRGVNAHGFFSQSSCDGGTSPQTRDDCQNETINLTLSTPVFVQYDDVKNTHVKPNLNTESPVTVTQNLSFGYNLSSLENQFPRKPSDSSVTGDCISQGSGLGRYTF